MNRSRLSLVGVAIASLTVGIAIGATFSFKVANAQTPINFGNFEVTAALLAPQPSDLPEKMKGRVLRLEDKQYGIVCYISGTNQFPLGCAKK